MCYKNANFTKKTSLTHPRTRHFDSPHILYSNSQCNLLPLTDLPMIKTPIDVWTNPTSPIHYVCLETTPSFLGSRPFLMDPQHPTPHLKKFPPSCCYVLIVGHASLKISSRDLSVIPQETSVGIRNSQGSPCVFMCMSCCCSDCYVCSDFVCIMCNGILHVPQQQLRRNLKRKEKHKTKGKKK